MIIARLRDHRPHLLATQVNSNLSNTTTCESSQEGFNSEVPLSGFDSGAQILFSIFWGLEPNGRNSEVVGVIPGGRNIGRLLARVPVY